MREIEQLLDPERLLSAASTAAGLSDYGDRSFIAPFCKYLEYCRREVSFSENGLRGFEADVSRVLVNRLRMQDDCVRHPEIEAEDVSDPIVIVGLVRSGTTKLQRMLAADRGLQSIPLWQILYSGRFPEAAAGAPDPRIGFAGKAGGFALGPEVVAINTAHAMSLEMPDEDIILFENTFAHLYMYLRTPVHSYMDWLRDQPVRGPYLYYRRILKYLQWQGGGRQERPFVLKATSHVAELPLLFELFPRATVVQCHRDPYECIPSYARLQEFVWSLRGTPLPAKTVGNAMLKVWGDVMRRGVQARMQLGPDCRVIDAPYEEIKDDPLAVVREIYAAGGRQLTPQTVQSMRTWESDNRQHQFGKHAYSAGHFELSKAQIAHEFEEYSAHFSKYF